MSTKTFGSYLAELRREKKMTQKEVADRLYVSDKTVSRWETDRSLPELSLVPAIADLLGVSADELLRSGMSQTEESEEESATNAMAENVAQIACRRFNRRGLIALILFFAAPALAIIMNMVGPMSKVVEGEDSMTESVRSVALRTSSMVLFIGAIFGSIIFLIVYFLIQNRHIRDCGAPENVRKMYQDRLRGRFVLYFGIIGFVILTLIGWILPAIGVIAVVLVCDWLLRSRRS